jgi:hypothetical protein
VTPVKQRNRHDPANGVYGDCHRAAVATVLDLALDQVPHFGEGGPAAEEFGVRAREFRRSKGLVPISAVYAPDSGHLLILHVVGTMNPGVPYLLGGRSRNGVDHTVVCVGDEIVHDPSLDDSGIVGPCGDGWYWVTFFGAADLDRRPRCGACGAPLTPDGLCSRAACYNSD